MASAGTPSVWQSVRGGLLGPGGGGAAYLVPVREALVQSLGADPVPFQLARAFREADSDGLPHVAGLQRFDQCSADIRQVNLLAELTQDLRITATAATRQVRVEHIEWRKDSIKRHPIASVSRPPAAVFAGPQLRLVHEWAELRAERLGEVTSQLGVPWRYWAAVVDLNPSCHAHTLELLSLALRMAYHVLQPMKHYLGCPRPAAYSPSIQPMIRPRRFDAFPSGHAVEAFLVARLLAVLCGPAGKALEEPLQRLATRIANNRVIAGVHFHIDSVAGRMVAESLAEYFLYRCRAEGGWLHRQFEGHGLKVGQHPALMTALDRSEVLDGAAVSSPYFLANRAAMPLAPPLGTGLVEDGPGPGLLSTLWQQAGTEW